MVYFKQLCSLRLLVISGAGIWDAWSAMSWCCFVVGDWIHVFSHRLFKCLDCLIFQPWPTLTPPPNHTLPNRNEVVQDTFPYLCHCLICFFSFSPIFIFLLSFSFSSSSTFSSSSSSSSHYHPPPPTYSGDPTTDTFTEETYVLGIPLHKLSQPIKFIVCVCGVMVFYLLYGYAQVSTCPFLLN